MTMSLMQSRKEKIRQMLHHPMMIQPPLPLLYYVIPWVLISALCSFRLVTAFLPTNHQPVLMNHHHNLLSSRYSFVAIVASASEGNEDSAESTRSSATTGTDQTLVVSLTKPFGLMLEEMEGNDGGVLVQDVGTTGSAVPFADQIRGAQIGWINNVSVMNRPFDDVMELMKQTDESSPFTIEFILTKPPLEVGTPVSIVVLNASNNQRIEIHAKVGDNLRQTLLNNNVEVYQGMQKLSNCGGAGQCTLCAFDFLPVEESTATSSAKNDGTESTTGRIDHWDVRSNYENDRLKKFPAARLTCLNIIQGPATIRKTKR
jgi:ferredoxin